MRVLAFLFHGRCGTNAHEDALAIASRIKACLTLTSNEVNCSLRTRVLSRSSPTDGARANLEDQQSCMHLPHSWSDSTVATFQLQKKRSRPPNQNTTAVARSVRPWLAKGDELSLSLRCCELPALSSSSIRALHLYSSSSLRLGFALFVGNAFCANTKLPTQ